MPSIAFIGRIGSGKTTLANAMAEATGGVRLSFAYPLKQECAVAIMYALDGGTLRELDLPDSVVKLVEKTIKELPQDVFTRVFSASEEEMISILSDASVKHYFRQLQQYWGTEFRRSQNENYWVDKFESSLIQEGINGRNVFIDDCRYTNEMNLLEDYGTVFVTLEDNPLFPFDPVRDAHASEQDWSAFPTMGMIRWCPLDRRVEAVNKILELSHQTV